MKKHNFSAGPSILVPEVSEKTSRALLDFEGTDLSVTEISHRSAEFVCVIERARSLVLEIASLDDTYTALFLQRGASMQFLMVPYNLLERRAVYVDTGTWASEAHKEAILSGEAIVVASSKAEGYKYTPKEINVPTEVSYLHIITNNTIYDTEYRSTPDTKVSLVADMGSDIFSRSMDYSRFDLIYVGSQKNLGASGSTLVLMKGDILGKAGRKPSSMMDYQLHIKNDSMYSTPSTFVVYVNLLILEWLQAQGGLKAMEVNNRVKADLLYVEIDRNPLLEGYVEKEDRSLMDVVSNLKDESIQMCLDSLCKEANISGVKGHRSVGGYRASIYNAMPVESVQVLVEALKESG